MKRRDGRRAEARGTAREKLLDSAAKVFAERGYSGASTDEMAADAGVTKGALYWHFKNKQELFFALIEERVDRRARALMQITESAPREQETAALVGSGITDILTEERDLILLTHEYWSLAVREPQLLQRYTERQRSLSAALTRALQARHETTGVPLSYPAERLATAIMALAGGLASERIADPESVPPQLLGDMLALIYDGLVHQAEAAAPAASHRQRSASTARKPEELHALFAHHANGGDVDALVRLYEPDAIYVSPEGGQAKGAAAIREMLGQALAIQTNLETTTRHAIVAGDIALLASHWHASFKAKKGKAAHAQGTSTEIARRQPDGTWLYLLDTPASLD